MLYPTAPLYYPLLAPSSRPSVELGEVAFKGDLLPGRLDWARTVGGGGYLELKPAAAADPAKRLALCGLWK